MYIARRIFFRSLTLDSYLTSAPLPRHFFCVKVYHTCPYVIAESRYIFYTDTQVNVAIVVSIRSPHRGPWWKGRFPVPWKLSIFFYLQCHIIFCSWTLQSLSAAPHATFSRLGPLRKLNILLVVEARLYFAALLSIVPLRQTRL